MLDDTKRRNGNTVGWTAHDDKSNTGRWRLVNEPGAGLPSPGLNQQHQGLFSSLYRSVRRALPTTTSFNSSSSSASTSSRRLSLSTLSPLDPSSASSPWSWSSIRFVLLCSLWYTSSAMSSNTGKVILNAYRYPVTLTIIQFAFVAGFSFLCCQPYFGFTTLRRPTRAILNSTLPMAAFQVGGHVFSSVAISRIPVSTVHTIKALSPMFTVAAYAILFRVKYSPATYMSLLPLTIGVMLACSFDVSASDFLGLLSAFGSAVVFVSSNIFFKKVMPSGSASTAHKLDKINLLLYSSGLAFLLMIPIWIYSDLGALLYGSSAAERLAAAALSVSTATSKKRPVGPPPPALTIFTYYVLNGTVHWAQNMLAFLILSSTSPVTYSIASLVKRIAVICIAVVYFGQVVHPVQGFGIGMTFFGLWMYNRAKGDVEKGERKVRREEAKAGLMLPSTREEAKAFGGSGRSSPAAYASSDEKLGGENGYALSSAIPRPNYEPGSNNGYGHHAHGGVHTMPISISASAPLSSSSLSGAQVATTAATAPVPVPYSSRSHRLQQQVPPPLNLSSYHKDHTHHHKTSSPTGSYPSPPPSDTLGSPTPTSPPQRHATSYVHPAPVYTNGAQQDQVMKNRRGTVDSGSMGGGGGVEIAGRGPSPIATGAE